MSEQYVGNLKRTLSKGGKEYFKGFFGKVPVVGFWGKSNADQINLKLDVVLIKWIDEQEDDSKPGTRPEVNANIVEQEPVVNGNIDEPLPF